MIAITTNYMVNLFLKVNGPICKISRALYLQSMMLLMTRQPKQFEKSWLNLNRYAKQQHPIVRYTPNNENFRFNNCNSDY